MDLLRWRSFASIVEVPDIEADDSWIDPGHRMTYRLFDRCGLAWPPSLRSRTPTVAATSTKLRQRPRLSSMGLSRDGRKQQLSFGKESFVSVADFCSKQMMGWSQHQSTQPKPILYQMHSPRHQTRCWHRSCLFHRWSVGYVTPGQSQNTGIPNKQPLFARAETNPSRLRVWRFLCLVNWRRRWFGPRNNRKAPKHPTINRCSPKLRKKNLLVSGGRRCLCLVNWRSRRFVRTT